MQPTDSSNSKPLVGSRRLGRYNSNLFFTPQTIVLGTLVRLFAEIDYDMPKCLRETRAVVLHVYMARSMQLFKFLFY